MPRPGGCADIIAGEDNGMGKGLLLWLIGIPIPVILILFLIFR